MVVFYTSEIPHAVAYKQAETELYTKWSFQKHFNNGL